MLHEMSDEDTTKEVSVVLDIKEVMLLSPDEYDELSILEAKALILRRAHELVRQIGMSVASYIEFLEATNEDDDAQA